MPEIKHQFTGGKMNKDLDERLVPNGEYRDAMNIQVSTSEESDVGTIQNILGNKRLTHISTEINVNPNAVCVGSISDEKNDSLYWFIREPHCGFVDNSYSVLIVNTFDGSFGDTRTTDQYIDSKHLLISPDVMDKHQLEVGHRILGLGIPYKTYVASTELLSASTTTTGFTSTKFYGMWLIVLNFYEGGSINQDSLGPLLNYDGSIWQYDPTIYEYQNYLSSRIVSFVGDFENDETAFNQAAQAQNAKWNNGAQVCKDLILKYNPYIDSPGAYNIVFNDLKFVEASIYFRAIDGVEVPNPASGDIHISQDGWDAINVGDIISYVSDGYVNYPVNKVVISKTTATGNLPIINIGKFTDTPFAFILHYNTSSNLILAIERGVLKFPSIDPLDMSGEPKIITAINIIDDILLWTDGQNEPRKINIERSIIGTEQNGLTRTKLVNTVTDPNILLNNGFVKEEHVTVIKKRPNKAPKLSALTSFRSGLISSTAMRWRDRENGTTRPPFVDLAGNIYPVGNTVASSFWTSINDNIAGEAVNFKTSDVLRFHSNENELLAGNYEVRARIQEPIGHGNYNPNTNPQASPTQSSVALHLEEIYPGSEQNLLAIHDWYVKLEELEKPLFEQKIPRFSSRYKYEDNEYSAPGPFTEAVFIPGNFNYHPTEAYNIGMVNTLKELTLQDFISTDIPKDVTQVDLLYKNETSPNLYVIESITKQDSSAAGTDNGWNAQGSQSGLFGSHKISTENIYSTLPSNQLLRHWDNVPRAAEAQEISGNRIIYGNYLQNYNMKNSINLNVTTPTIITSLGKRGISDESNVGKKSIKSLRSYDIGIVWGDKYGRETPVITPSSAATIVPKKEATNSNALCVQLLSDHPDWADYYKIFVKETSNEYYNLAMDRVYDAGDNNIWVSFPSVDRNKVDEDTYLILKKGTDTETAVTEEARYKIVAIENEAPDYIKTSYEVLAESNPDDSSPLNSYRLFGGLLNPGGVNGTTDLPAGFRNAPDPGRKSFSIGKLAWTGPRNTVPNAECMSLPDLKELFDETAFKGNELIVEFSRKDDSPTVNQVSKKYKVVGVSTEEGTAPVPDVFVIKLNEPIFSNDSFITDNGSTIFPLFFDGVKVHFYSKKIENKPEFDGRFFVKIKNDELAKKELSLDIETDNNWMTDAATQFYHLKDNHLSYSGTTYAYNLTTAATSLTHPRAKASWEGVLKFGGSTTKATWFVDNMPFATRQEESSGVSHSSGNASSFMNTPLYDASSHVNQTWYHTFLTGTTTLNSGTVGESENVGTGMSNGILGMKGAHGDGVIGGNNYLDLSYSKVGPSRTGWNSLGHYASANYYTLNWTVGGTAAQNSYTDEEADVVSSLRPNQVFTIKGSNQDYRIISVTKFRLFNYMGHVTMNASVVYNWSGLGTTTWWNKQIYNQLAHISRDTNKRVTYRIKYDIAPGSSDSAVLLTDSSNTAFNSVTSTIPGEIQFRSQFSSSAPQKISTNPAIFETEPKEDIDLDIYYEATNRIPTKLTLENRELFIPIGTTLHFDPNSVLPKGIFVTNWIGTNALQFSINLNANTYSSALYEKQITLIKDDGSFINVIVEELLTIGKEDPIIYGIEISILPQTYLGWFNCWSFNNGVESNRLGDTFNKPFITNGVKVSSTIIGNYEEELRINGLIYSGIYNPNSNTNELNQFVTAEKITKDLSPVYGSIQKLHSRSTADGDLIALCEDRVLKILAEKDALFNADGNVQLTSTNNVLGKAIPFSGEYGISKNPESFASEAYRVYFTDKVRGVVMRLSKDGLTPISMYGMKDWFKDNLKLSKTVLGSYDDKKEEYNVTIKYPIETVGINDTKNATVSFKEDVKGWVSFKSFIPENAISCANEYYTFIEGDLYKHHANENRNTFYGIGPDHADAILAANTYSSLTVMLNDGPGSIKSFHALNYEGSQSKIDMYTNTSLTLDYQPTTSYNDQEYYNLSVKSGWFVESVVTDKDAGHINNFVEKEGKWFANMNKFIDLTL